jgi:TPR repeat protein
MRRIATIWLVLALGGCVAAPSPVPSLARVEATAAERARGAQLYRQGQALARTDADRAAGLIEQAATLGHAEAQFHLGMALLLARDGAGAAPWFALAGAQGHVEAMFQLARVLDAGQGVRQERAFAAVWFQRAGERGHLPALQAMALLQILGQATARDEAEALARLALAAERGHRPAIRYRDALRPRVPPAAAAAALARLRGETARGPVAALDRPLLRFVQSALVASGAATLRVDGQDGPATRAAALAFARREGIATTSPYAAPVIDALRRRFPGS